ncbi:hypothetical protein AA106555_1865 [Neokomagataea thailandica NBRC 106555]|nr:hypothetical protein AA106555_1865 [Neokomagataea thailandica NBRC 106555]
MDVVLGVDNDPRARHVDDILASAEKTASESKVVLATLFNESDAFLMMYLDNFLAFTPDNVSLVVNFPPGRSIPPEATSLHPRIVIFNGLTERQKWGETLMLGHLESLQLAENHFDRYDYFAVMASNSLFHRPFNLASILVQLDLGNDAPLGSERSYDNDTHVPVDALPSNGTWMWQHCSIVPEITRYFDETLGLKHLSVTQIEGLFATRESWLVLLAYKEAIAGLGQFCNNGPIMALEELLPPSIFRQHASGQFVHLCHMLWKKAREVTVTDLVDLGPNLPDHICSMKWFARDGQSASTLAVTTSWGRELMGLTPTATLGNSVTRLLTLRAMADAAEKHVRATSLTCNWWKPDVERQETALRWATSTYHAYRQRFDLPVQVGVQEEPHSPAHLYFENTGDVIDLTLFLSDADETRSVLHYGCFSNAGQNAHRPVLQAYLYLTSFRPNSHFRVSVTEEEFSTITQYAGFVFFNGQDYMRKAADLVIKTAQGRDLYFKVDKQICWLGIPVFSSHAAKLELSVVHD